MGLSEGVRSREGIIASMKDVALKQFLFLRNLAGPVIARFGAAGMKVLDDAFAHHGRWRGEGIRMSQASIVCGRDALACIANWDSCDLVRANASGAIVRWDQLKARGDHLCQFRISIAELASPNDPEYVRPA